MTAIDTEAGRIHGGTTLTKRADVQAYLGIPFAAPPVGELRFRPPAPVEPWDGVRETKRFAPAAPQNPDPMMVASGYYVPPTSEQDCLNLNVWTPRNDDRRRPVLVWIHGGAYVTGSNSSGYNNGAELAATLDVVVVSINYRLGILGFLHLGHVLGDGYRDSANLAILDQLAALRWVRDNILKFGGDPDNVTVFGESAGGAAVGTLLGTPASQGLFRRAIIQSGTAERARDEAQSIAVTSAVLAEAGLTDATASDLIHMPIERLLEVQQRISDQWAQKVIGLPLPFQPMWGGDVLPEFPLDAVRHGVNTDVDLLVGTNLNEGSFFTELRPESTGDHRSARERTELVIAEDFGDTIDYTTYAATVAEVLGTEPAENQVLESYLSDRLYRQPTNRLLDARAHARGRTYAYLFTWPSPLMDGRLGSCHALDVPFVFRQLHRIEAVSLVGENPPEQLSDWMSVAWTRFAREGVPESAGLPVWPRYDQSTRETMILDLQPRVESDPRAALRHLWSEKR